MMELMRCPLCDSLNNIATGLVRLASGAVAEGRQCRACGERWAIDDSGVEVRERSDPEAWSRQRGPE
jgi:transcriptional regulator NrdR family protein